MRIPSWILFSVVLIQLSWSIPALDRYYTVTQPDGSTIEIRKKGNEHFHYTETKDGQVVAKDHRGVFKPATKDTIRHHLKDIPRPSVSSSSALLKAPAAIKTPSYQNSLQGEKNVLVVLVQFADTKFFSKNPASDINRILTEEGYGDDNSVGSVTDYFKDNSLEKFTPIFDIVGPITVSGNNYKDYGELSQHGDYGAQRALTEALDTLKTWGIVDFKKYDNDGDNVLDYVHMIYAGFGAHDSDQDSAIWPHKWILSEPKNLGSNGRFSNGPYIIEYACSAERDGIYNSYVPNAKKYFGVGSFIHEFSHLLGLPDLYPTDGSFLYTLSLWDVMDMGAYNTTNRYGPTGTSPPYYSTFERMSLGWLTPDDLVETESDTLRALQNNVARQLKNPENENEFFLLEYRSGSKWDSALPNHGMLIWHIDYKKDVWENSEINNTEHQHVDIVEADGVANENSQSKDVFPGTAFTKYTYFNRFITWDETDLKFRLANISEDSDRSYVTFEVFKSKQESGSTESSSSDAVIEESSSSQEELSSSSEESSSSNEKSSSSSAKFSSSSVKNSSSSVKSSSSEADNPLTISHGQLHINSTEDGLKTLHVFSLNGQLLEKIQFEGTTIPLALKKYRQPLLLSISQRGKVLGRTLFIFRE